MKYDRYKFIRFKNKKDAERFSDLYKCGEVFCNIGDKYPYYVLIRNGKEEMAKIIKANRLKKMRREERNTKIGYSNYIYEWGSAMTLFLFYP